MAWIKRNLFFVIGGVVALVLLGGAGFYIWQGMQRNSKAYTDLTEVVGTLKTLTDQKPSPGGDKFDNTKIASQQDKDLQAWIAASSASFQPIPAIPPGGSVTGASFSGALQKTVDTLLHEADTAGVILPSGFYFSFTAEKNRVTFSPAGLDLLAVQLGEVKAISEIMFSTRVNAFDSIQRVRMSDDDAAGQLSDYIDERPVTNELAVITPYVIGFRCFTPELARVMSGFATASNTFIVKYVNVQPAGAAMAIPGGPGMVGEAGGMPPARMMGEGGYPPAQVAPAPVVTGKGGLQTVLKEQLLRITMEIELVKLLPKN